MQMKDLGSLKEVMLAGRRFSLGRANGPGKTLPEPMPREGAVGRSPGADSVSVWFEGGQ